MKTLQTIIIISLVFTAAFVASAQKHLDVEMVDGSIYTGNPTSGSGSKFIDLVLDSGIDNDSRSNLMFRHNGYNSAAINTSYSQTLSSASILQLRTYSPLTDIIFSPNSIPRIFIDGENGNLGLGVSIPSQSLHIGNNGNIRLDGSSSTYTIFNTYEGGGGANILQIDPFCTDITKSSIVRLFRSVNTNGAALKIFRGNNTTQVNHLLHSYNENSYLCALAGNVGIGTTDPLGYKLAVKGNIGAEGIEVRTNYWADFVFENDYQLRSIEEIEDFINENKHLPTMPSEKEATNSPLNLGDMDVKLLQTVEEQMLYIIELKKENEAQQNLIEQQAFFIQQVEKRLEKLEQQKDQ